MHLIFPALLFLTSCLAQQENLHGMLWEHNLQGPFVDSNGASGSAALQNWIVAGNSAVKKNFIRLTPDRPSKAGSLLNVKPAPLQDWTVLLRFRISGQNEHMSGDGMAFWYTSGGDVFREGMVMGATDTFVGFGVLFDTFANDHLHRDVVVVVSNGQEPLMLTAPIMLDFPGCESKFRRWEGRDDFDIDQDTTAKISFVDGNRVVVEIDAMSTGDFITCVDRNVMPYLPGFKKNDKPNWRKNAHFALSAATGALHDNHDVLELLVTEAQRFEDVMLAHEELVDGPSVQVDTESSNVTAQEVGAQVNTLAYELKDVDDRLQKLHHQIEHEVEKVAHRLENLIGKLVEQEARVEKRVMDLEQRAGAEVMRLVDLRIQTLERTMQQSVDQKTLHVESVMEKTRTLSEQSTGSVRWMFWIFFVLVFAVLGYLGFTVYRLNTRVNSKSDRYLG